MRKTPLSLIFGLILIVGCVKKQHNTVTTFAGSGLMGALNGKADSSSFANPIGITTDAAGNLLIADAYNNLIRKISPEGIVSTLAGSGKAGSTDGKGDSASFFYPDAITTDAKGNAYVADKQNNLIRKITPEGLVTTIAGRTEKNEDYGGKYPLFDYPAGIATDSAGNIYVADSFHNKIRKIAADGKITTLAGNINPGAIDGTGAAASFYIPQGLAFDIKGNLYVADTFNNMIRKITPAGIVTTVAGETTKGLKNGKGKSALFLHPTGVTVDKNGNIYVTDSGNNLIRKIDPSGLVSTLAGSHKRGSLNGNLKDACFYKPMGLALDKQGNIYVADFENNIIREIYN